MDTALQAERASSKRRPMKAPPPPDTQHQLARLQLKVFLAIIASALVGLFLLEPLVRG